MSPEEEKTAIFRSLKFLSDEVQRIDGERVTPDEIASKTADRLIAKFQDEATVEAVVSVWGRVLDQHLGKSVRKMLWAIFLIACGVIAVQFEWIGKIFR